MPGGDHDPDVIAMEASAHDLLSMKREMQEREAKEISRDLSNVLQSDSFEELAFKIFEQLKGYNNRLSEFNKNQKEVLRDLKEMEKHMQKDENYVKLKEELAFTETSVLEVEAKLQMLHMDMGRVAEAVQQVLYMKSQVKQQGSPVEFSMPSAVQDTMVKIQRGVRDNNCQSILLFLR